MGVFCSCVDKPGSGEKNLCKSVYSMEAIDQREKTVKIKKEFVLRKIGDDHVLIPIGETIAHFNGLVNINEMGVFLWEHLQEETTKEELVRAVLQEYEADREKVEADVTAFLEKLSEQEII